MGFGLGIFQNVYRSVILSGIKPPQQGEMCPTKNCPLISMDISCRSREKPLTYLQGPLLQQRNMSIAITMRRKLKNVEKFRDQPT